MKLGMSVIPERWGVDEVSPMTALVSWYERVFQALVQGGGNQAETVRPPACMDAAEGPRIPRSLQFSAQSNEESQLHTENSRDLQRLGLEYLAEYCSRQV